MVRPGVAKGYFAARASTTFARDVLGNAGTVAEVASRRASERTLSYLLIRSLTESLARSDNARVITVSSVLHRGGRFDWADPQRAHRYSKLSAFAQSQLALTIFTTSLSESVTAVSVDPGPTDPQILRVRALES
ncbi:hypothetical protein [Pseudonocardia alaniniphila]|uniref:Short subunit dehydrogenase n=1 Tax=Pseudonocardia alaniniphila TaxID=75291 RepID=A0ABS9TDD3_9PSEU|nr:hypothetical protein [Pseudonocardia alaniniphila]MCH6166549.1 hypothetical protein [Pseudonocardia alaniniphila]